MTRICVDADMRAKLLGCHEPLELCDDTGQVVAHLIPAADLSAFEPWEPPIDEEELNRREQSTAKRYTTSEVLAYIEQLDK